MEPNRNQDLRAVLPTCAVAYIGQVTKKMRYRRRARAEVGAELTAHFEEALKDRANAEEREAKARELIEQFGDARLLAILCRRAKKRCRPLWKKVLVRSVQCLGVFLLYSVVCSLPLHFGKPTIRVNYIEWLSNHWQPTQPEVENAKHYYDEATRLYVAPPRGLEEKRSTWSRSFAADSQRNWFTDYNDADMELLGQWLADNEPAFDTLRRGARTPHYWPAYDIESADLSDPNFLGEAMKGLKGYRQVALAFREKTAYQAHQGDLEGALDDCLTVWTFGLHMQGKGLLNEQLVGIAIEALGSQGLFVVLSRCEVPSDMLERVHTKLAALVNPQRSVISLDGEAVLWHDLIQRNFTDDGRGGGHALSKGIPYAAGDWLDNLAGILVFDYPDRREAEAMVEQYFGQMGRELLLPPYEKASTRNPGRVAIRPAPNALLDLVAPAHERVGQILWRMKTGELAVLTTVAVLRYALERNGYPATLDQLVQAGYLSAVPNDPFGEGSLSYRKTVDGFLLYSWGANLKDDGGQLDTNDEGKPRTWADNGDWVFWPVWKPEAKR
jgi:hypothetical protein